MNIKELKASFAKSPDHVSQSDLGSVAPACEHGLARKESTDGNPVKAARQEVAFPDLNAVGIAKQAQRFVGLNHVGDNPGAFFSPFGTAPDDAAEVRVDRDLKSTRAQGA